MGVGRWKRQNRKNLYLYPYVEEPLNSKVIKSFVPEQKVVVFVFRDSYVLCIYVMNILCTFHIAGYLDMLQRDSISLWRFIFRSPVRVFLWATLLISRLKYLYSCISFSFYLLLLQLQAALFNGLLETLCWCIYVNLNTGFLDTYNLSIHPSSERPCT